MELQAKSDKLTTDINKQKQLKIDTLEKSRTKNNKNNNNNENKMYIK